MQLRQYAAKVHCSTHSRPIKLRACKLQSNSGLASTQQQLPVGLSFNSSRHLCHAARSPLEDHNQQLHASRGQHKPSSAMTDSSSSSSSSSSSTSALTSDEIKQYNGDGPRLQKGAADGSAPEEGIEQMPRRRRSVKAAAAAAAAAALAREYQEYPGGPWTHPNGRPEDYSRVRSRGLPRQTALAPGVKRTGKPAQVLIARQLRDLMKNPIPGIEVEPDENDAMVWHAQLEGPAGSPYEGGTFKVDMIFTDNFPGEQPTVRFRTPIWHPNVATSNVGATWGHTWENRVCVKFGTNAAVAPGSAGIPQVRSAACVLVGLQFLMSTNDPGCFRS